MKPGYALVVDVDGEHVAAREVKISQWQFIKREIELNTADDIDSFSEGIHQSLLTKQTSLSAALDKAAGGRAADPRHEGLFDKVRDEYLRYYTERRAERKELSESRNALTDAQSEVARIDQAIRDLDQDIERAAVLQRELVQLKKQEAELTKIHDDSYTETMGAHCATEREYFKHGN